MNKTIRFICVLSTAFILGLLLSTVINPTRQVVLDILIAVMSYLTSEWAWRYGLFE